MLNCYIQLKNEKTKMMKFSELKKEDYDKVIKVIFHELTSEQLELYVSDVYCLTNLERLETSDSKMKPEYPNKLGNFIHLHTLSINHFSNFSPLFISKCYQCNNKAIITNYHPDIVVNSDIEYLNIFVNYIDDNTNINEHNMTKLLNNLHIGLKYLQINIIDFEILKFICNLPITLETFNVIITETTKDILYESKEYYIKDAYKTIDNIKIPLNCKLNIQILE
jgi:hypothetical protein